ncbi:hypothetical protein CC79DRAFT_1335147 [Sarocladium strictum]
MTRKSQPSRSLLFLLALVASPHALAVDSDFTGLYPDAAISCLNKASDQSNCNGASSNKALNECLCSNTGDFVVNSAQCLGEEASDQVRPVYQTMAGACFDSDTPLAVSPEDFYAIADGKQSSPSTTISSISSTSTSSTSSTASEGPTETSDNNDNSDSGGLSTGAIAGIGAGAGVLAIAVIGGLVAWCIRRRRRAGEESHPMLPTDNIGDHHNGNPYHGATTFPPTEPSPGLHSQFDKDPKTGRYSAVSGLSPGGMGGYSPSMTNNTASPPLTGGMVSSWGSAPPGWNGAQYQGAYATPPPQGAVAELPTQPAAPVFEMDGGQQPAAGQGHYSAELSGSTPQQYQSYDSHRR